MKNNVIIHGKGEEEYCVDIKSLTIDDLIDIKKNLELKKVPKECITDLLEFIWDRTKNPIWIDYKEYKFLKRCRG